MEPVNPSRGRAEGMAPEALFSELERLLAHLGVEVHVEPFDEEAASSGGLCLLYGKSLLIVDSNLALGDRNRLILECLRGFDLEGVYAAPYVREQIGRGASGGGPTTFDSGPSGPGSIP